MKLSDIVIYGVLITVIAVFGYKMTALKSDQARLATYDARALAFQSCLEVEDRFLNATLHSLDVLNEAGQTVVGSEFFTKAPLSVLIVTSLKDCDECRDLELERWGLFSLENDTIPISLVLLDDV